MDQEKRFRIAMAIYAVLAILIWLTMDGSSVPMAGGKISLRGLTLALIAFFAARTLLHWRADKIRGEREHGETGVSGLM